MLVLDDVPATAPWTVLTQESDATLYYAGYATIELFRADAAK
ncbi:hypothetical protein V1291_000144 [Nitrobacteraceae bacterium AZCC 1564]